MAAVLPSTPYFVPSELEIGHFSLFINGILREVAQVLVHPDFLDRVLLVCVGPSLEGDLISVIYDGMDPLLRFSDIDFCPSFSLSIGV